MNSSASLLVWEQTPCEAFARFVVSREFLATGKARYEQAEARLVSPPSAKVYLSMFKRFIGWMRSLDASPPLSLPSLSMTHLRSFLAIEDADSGRPRLASNIAYRYLRLIDRVLSHLGRQPNPARHLLEEMRMQRHRHATHDGAHGEPTDCCMVVLTANQLTQFIAALPDPKTARYSGSNKRPYAPWKRERDRALLCMIAGAGLKPAEVIGMTVDEFDPTPELGGEHDGYFRLTLKPAGKHPTSFGHVAYLDPQLAPDILHWLRARPLLKMQGDLLFPSTRGGKTLSFATVYLLTKHTFVRAGIAVMRSGGRTLRNSYAVREIARAVDKHALKSMLGLALENSTQLYFKAAQGMARESKAQEPRTTELQIDRAEG